MIGERALAFVGRLLAGFLTKPIRGFKPSVTTDPELLRQALQPGDVLLVEGDTRVSTAIKYLTQSTWSHAALYVGPAADRCEPTGEPHVLVEADVKDGVICVPFSKYQGAHMRICRPVGLDESACRTLCDFAIARLGSTYDLKNIFDLLRYLLPTPPVPSRFRRRMISLGSGSPTQAICSTLIAQAFQSVHYPILPEREQTDDPASPAMTRRRRRETLRKRHHSLFVPRDFDISPYFAIVKPQINMAFDYTSLKWAKPPPTTSQESSS